MIKFTVALLGLSALVKAFGCPTDEGTSVDIPASQFGANNSFIIPEDSPNGIFLVQPSATNASQPVLTLVKLDSNLNSSRESFKAVTTNTKRDPLPISVYGCANWKHIQEEYRKASDDFKWYCDNGDVIPGKTIFVAGILYVRVGNSIAFGCSFGGNNPCSGDEFDQFNGWADDKCGWWTSGWVEMGDWKKSYGRQIVMEAICGYANGEIH